ncbi:hypothetical protein B0H10DRAFT_2221564 [Mycena sp. CBHHK59/15]|nr:hypothetical protein B0H10DRAFT_2233737 [Mycena sp. CBHHK59/15]KAJ6614093.1 hypothetical protein B0H10DRAFT_2221564 [Mycena sp. CBHHK59/15]
MDALFEPPDHLYIMCLARKEDTSGMERKRKAELADFRIRLAKMKKDKEIAKHQKEVDDLRTLVKLVNLTVKKLHQQLDAFCLRGAALEAALKNYLLSPELYPVPESVLSRISVTVVRPATEVVEEWVEEEDIEMED